MSLVMIEGGVWDAIADVLLRLPSLGDLPPWQAPPSKPLVLDYIYHTCYVPVACPFLVRAFLILTMRSMMEIDILRCKAAMIESCGAIVGSYLEGTIIEARTFTRHPPPPLTLHFSRSVYGK